jgi:carbonic anhydrase/acetyltransferase-like protein (isoleucine patch superfamily)
MALILPFGGRSPRIGRDVFLAPNATLIGDIEIADGASIWFGAVLRGDIGSIRIGPRTNVQDLACIHLTEGLSQTILGADVTVGHGAILHGCVVGDRCLVGMGSIVLDNAEVGESSVIAAGSVVTARTVIPPRSLVRGTPAKVIREATPEEAALGASGAGHYLEAARRYRALCADIPEVAPTPMPYPIQGR